MCDWNCQLYCNQSNCFMWSLPLLFNVQRPTSHLMYLPPNVVAPPTARNSVSLAALPQVPFCRTTLGSHCRSKQLNLRSRGATDKCKCGPRCRALFAALQLRWQRSTVAWLCSYSTAWKRMERADWFLIVFHDQLDLLSASRPLLSRIWRTGRFHGRIRNRAVHFLDSQINVMTTALYN